MFTKGKSKEADLNPSASVSSSTARRRIRWIGKALLGSIVALLVLAVAGATYQALPRR